MYINPKNERKTAENERNSEKNEVIVPHLACNPDWMFLQYLQVTETETLSDEEFEAICAARDYGKHK